MASQYGQDRIFKAGDGEAASAQKVQCPQCKTNSVPRPIVGTHRVTDTNPKPVEGGGKVHCAYCGHIFGRDSLLGDLRVKGIVVSGAGGATTITVDNATLQMAVAVAPAYAKNKAVTWSIVAGTAAVAPTISASGLVTPGTGATANGTATVRATANDCSGVIGDLLITLSNQA